MPILAFGVAIISWVVRVVGYKVVLIGVAVGVAAAITVAFTLGMTQAMNGITPIMHPYVYKGLSLLPVNTDQYISIFASSSVLKWLYDKQWLALNMWLRAV